MKRYCFFFVVLCSMLLVSCRRDVIVDFVPIADHRGEDTVFCDFDLTDGVVNGLSLPSKEDSSFRFTLKVDNPDNKEFYYKIYYQNISYAFDNEDSLCCENFYGSWEECRLGFKPLRGSEIEDHFRIVGNPRNEKKYYGEFCYDRITDDDISQIITQINQDPKWLSWVKQQAEKNNISLDKQLIKDAVWFLRNARKEELTHNCRERRNPRVGLYQFMIVVADKDALKKIPDYIQDISLTNQDSAFVNPFDYFLNKEGKHLKGVSVRLSKQHLKAKAKFNLQSGIYTNRIKYPNADYNPCTDDSKVGDNDSLYHYAQFEQYYHAINRDRFINQVQQLADVSSGDFTLADYLQNEKDSLTLPREKVHPYITDHPGNTVKVTNRGLMLINPGNEDIATARKESTGVRTRIGFTYGKFRAKVKFPPILNPSGVWTGITNAFWMIYQSERPWNFRRKSVTGYVKNNYKEIETERLSETNYSEIDIEMVKTSPYWNKATLQQAKDKGYDPYRNNMFVFASTNWDLACNDNGFLSQKNSCLFPRKDTGKEFWYHRWHESSRALTCRVEVSNDIFLQPYYYFEIEWQPKQIIWRIGPDPEHMQIVGFMSDEFTTIPNNQMLATFTQKFHYGEYWPPVIFEQGLIPYPSKDIIGEIFELTVE